MSKLIVIDREGNEYVLRGEPGQSVMKLMQERGVEGEFGLCGGCCSCATCHVFVDPAFLERLTPMSDQEDDMLSLSEDRNETSRLSCQIKWTDALDGLRVTLAPQA